MRRVRRTGMASTTGLMVPGEPTACVERCGLHRGIKVSKRMDLSPNSMCLWPVVFSTSEVQADLRGTEDGKRHVIGRSAVVLGLVWDTCDELLRKGYSMLLLLKLPLGLLRF